MKRATKRGTIDRVTLGFFSGLFFLGAGLAWASPLSAVPPSGHPDEASLSLGQRAEILLFRKQYEEAIPLYAEILKGGNADSRDFRGLARAFQGAGRLSEAEKPIKEYLSSRPRSSPALYGYGYYLYLSGRGADAEDYLRRALEQDPGNSLALNNLGAALAGRKAFSEAVDRVKKAISINPEESFFFQNLKSIYEEMGEPGRFLEEYRKNLRDGSKPLAEGYGKAIAVSLRQAGFKLYSQGKMEDAIRKFSDMVQTYREIDHAPGVVAGLFSLATLYEEMGDVQNAEKFYREVLKINPNHIQAREKIKGAP